MKKNAIITTIYILVGLVSGLKCTAQTTGPIIGPPVIKLPINEYLCAIKYEYDLSGNRIRRSYSCDNSPINQPVTSNGRMPSSKKIVSVDAPFSTIIFPNPSEGIFAIKTSVDLETAVVNVLSQNGVVVATFIYSGTQMQFDIRHLASGNYIIQVISERAINTQKLMKQ
jgi:Secretion system C-terminal sorting domain